MDTLQQTPDNLPTWYRLDIEPLRPAPQRMYAAGDDIWEDCPHCQGPGWQQSLVPASPVPHSVQLLRALVMAYGHNLHAVWSSPPLGCIYLQTQQCWYMLLSTIERTAAAWIVTLSLALIEESA